MLHLHHRHVESGSKVLPLAKQCTVHLSLASEQLSESFLDVHVSLVCTLELGALYVFVTF